MKRSNGLSSTEFRPPSSFEIPLAKAQYLFSRTNGTGGDKQKFWRKIMGFQSPEEITEAILKAVFLNSLEFQNQNKFGRLYRAYLDISGNSALTRRVKTIWIVLFDDDVARLVTAYPARLGGLSQ
ncbi:hypothetical protein NIES208_17740 [[Limnothrix rosea] IAM M-220]|nr:hypothetical protein NIES208_17740 [[Limnothrix rosea] IAM M-220]